jgi:hypothetical protein
MPRRFIVQPVADADLGLILIPNLRARSDVQRGRVNFIFQSKQT